MDNYTRMVDKIKVVHNTKVVNNNDKHLPIATKLYWNLYSKVCNTNLWIENDKLVNKTGVSVQQHQGIHITWEEDTLIR